MAPSSESSKGEYRTAQFAWKTGFWLRFPRTEVLSLLSAAIASSFMVHIVTLANNQPINSWRFQPTVYLSITYTIANIALQYALARAITIAWWVKALKGDAKIRDLHTIWASGSSFLEIITSGGGLRLVSLAGLAVTLVPINGPLLQRSVVVKEQSRIEFRNLTIASALDMPRGYTGDITGRNGMVPTGVSGSFGEVLKLYDNGETINITNSGCEGMCKGKMLGLGYEMHCWNESFPFVVQLDSANENPSQLYDFEPFKTNFTYQEVDDPWINFTATVKTESKCDANWTVSKCTLKPAIMEYSIVLLNDTITLDPDTSWKTDRTHEFPTPATAAPMRGPTTHGGMWMYLDALYKAGAWIAYDGVTGWRGGATGAAGIRYTNNVGEMNGHSVQGGCDMSFFDPTNDAMNTAREIAWRTALSIPKQNAPTQDSRSRLSNMTRADWDKTFLRQIAVQQTRKEVIYKSQYAYLAVAVVITLTATFCVLTISFGWWHLGREVSLSPIEIAKAFAAPCLDGAHSNAKVGSILKQIGKEKVRYGAVWDEGDYAQSVATLRFGRCEGSEKPVDAQEVR